MKKTKKSIPDSTILRRKAEKLIKYKPLETGTYLIDAETLRLVNELQIHQIELELHNEELGRSKEETETASKKYSELYDLAPTGFFTLSKEGIILELNLRGANMLGKQRSFLINSNFAFFVSDNTKSVFNLFLQIIFNKKAEQACEVILSPDDSLPKYVYLKGIVSNNEEQCIINVFDISERKKAEEVLSKSQELNRIMLQTAMYGFWQINMHGKLLEVNEAYCRMSGYSAQELLLMHVADLEALESENETIAHMQKILDYGVDFFESRHRRKDGSIFDVEISVQYQTEKGGRFVAFLRDITSRKQAEEALIESEKRYRSLFEQGNDAIFLLDLESGYYTDCNLLAEKLTGYTRQEILNLKTGALLPPHLKKEVSSNIELIVSNNLLRKETEILTRDGKIIPVEFNSSKIEIQKKPFILSMLHDITNRKAAEEALKQSEVKVRLKLQSILSPEGSIAELELNDIIDVQSIQKLMDDFYGLVQIPMAIIDLKGNVLVGVGWQDICTKFHRVHPESCRNCYESDLHLTQGIPDGEFRLYKCKNNMWDMATPLIIGDEHKGNLYLGQFFLENEPIIYEHFSNQARLYGFEEQEYMDALDKVPHLTNHTLNHAKSFFLNLSRSISQLSYSNIKLANAIAQQKINGDALRESKEFLNKSQEIAHLGSWSLDLEKNRLSWSDEMYNIFDILPEEFQGTYEGFLESVHPDDRDAINAAYTGSIIEGRDSYEIEHRIISKQTDEIKYVIEKCEHVRDTSGKIIRSVGMTHDITELKKATEALRENERLLRESQAVGNIGSYSVDLINRNWKASSEVYKIFGIDKTYSNSLDGWVDSLHPEFRNELINDLFNGEPGKEKFEHEYKIYRKNDSQERWVSGLGKFEYDGQLNPVRLIGTIQDITERKEKEKALHKLNRTMAALSKSSQAMSKAMNEADYLNQVCKIVVEDTDFAMVWIGYAEDDEAKTIRPMASAGFNNDYIETIKLSWHDSEIGHGPTGTAIRTGNISMCNNILTDPDFEPWREQALKRGYASSIVFPLKSGDKTFGAISIYSREPESFLEAEINLLTELANDLAYGITTIRLRAAHQLAVDQLSKSHGKLELLVKERTSELQTTNDLLKKEINIRKQQEQNLKMAEEKYRTIADYNYDWEYWRDENGMMLYCSPSCERITGFKASDFVQNSQLYVDIIHPDDLKIYLDHTKNKMTAIDNSIEINYRIIKSDGTIRWIGHVCQPVYNESGKIAGIRGSNRDITVRKIMEDQLITSNQKYKLLSENITDGIFIYKNACFEYINNALCQIFGYNNNEMVGMKLTQLILPEYQNELENFLELNTSLNPGRNFEVGCLKKDHSVIFVEMQLNYVANQSSIYGVIHDITEKKQLQKNIVNAIIQTEEKERAYFSKELHDGLGPLLSTIRLYLQWAQRPRIHKSRTEIIYKAEDLLEDALTTVKEISNKLSPHLLANYGLTIAVQRFIEKLKETCDIKIAIESNINRRFDMEIESALYRAISECINNTIKHSCAKTITINMIDKGEQIQIQYLDDGIGFDLDETLGLKKGLGLFNLQNRIQYIGGKIDMYSKPEQGVNYQMIVTI